MQPGAPAASRYITTVTTNIMMRALRDFMVPSEKYLIACEWISLVYGGEALKQALKQSQMCEIHQSGKIDLQKMSLLRINASMNREVVVSAGMVGR
jgi:hypothetical protein